MRLPSNTLSSSLSGSSCACSQVSPLPRKHSRYFVTAVRDTFSARPIARSLSSVVTP